MANVKVLVVAGGGGGATRVNGGRGAGGGGGGVLYSAAMDIAIQEYAVVVGVGGSICSATGNGNGANSSFNGLVAIGGGGGAYNDGIVGHNGGSGGGAWYNAGAGVGTVGQGNNGGLAATTPRYGGGGGGGAGGAGGPGSTTKGGNGGIGIQSYISGVAAYYGGGGSGDVWPGAGGVTTPGTAGLGGGGTGNNFADGTPGTPNTGGGGGAGNAIGGSGIVIIRYATADFGACTGGIITYDGTDTIHTFTVSGTFTVIEAVSAYKTSGTAIFGPTVLPVMTADPASSSISWTEDVPEGTEIVIKTAISELEPAEQDYQTVTNGGSIPGISQLSSGKNIYIKAYLSTSDVSLTPSLLSLSFEIVEAIDETKILLTLSDDGRIKYPEGDISVSYKKATGNLAGDLGGQVEDFDKSFTAININEVFNPNDAENITLSLSQTTQLIRIYYEDYKSADENISVALSQTTQLIHINDIPQ